MLDKRLKVPVAVQQIQPAFYASGRNHGINRFSHRYSQSSQRTKVPGCLNGNFLPSQVNHDQRSHECSGFIEVALAREALQHLGQNQVPCGNGFYPKQRVQFFRWGRNGSPEIVDPNAGIDQNHLSVLIASRSPCQSSFPRNRRISSCCRRRSSVRRPSSTASRLVFSPVARSVSFMSLSSITMLVRMMCIIPLLYTHRSLWRPSAQPRSTVPRSTAYKRACSCQSRASPRFRFGLREAAIAPRAFIPCDSRSAE
ncbi:Uncharacterized protein pbN1_40560 [Aromatoleum bremense]|nr:Uncharacterized protein pbN1_40560 [Aromatoleum bremense]